MPRKNEFPAIADAVDETATPPADAYDASRALSALWALCCAGLAKVYIPAGWHEASGARPQRWNVWLEITARRVELTAWVREWLATQEPETPETPENGGDAA